MQVRIGIVQSPKEIDIDLAEEDGDVVVEHITEAVSGQGMLWLTDRRGRRIGIASDKVAYIEIGADAGERRVGFSAL